MNNERKGIFDKIQQNSNIRPDDVYKIAESIKHADFSDETTVRNLVKHLSRLANKQISPEKENEIVQSIINNKMPMNMQSLNRFF